QTPTSQQATATTQLFGVIVDPQAGKQQTMSVTNDPNVIAEVKKSPVLQFVPINFNANAPRNASGQVDISGMKVILPNGQEVPLNPSGTTTFTLQAQTQAQPTNSNQAMNVPISIGIQGNTTPLAQATVPLQSLSQREMVPTIADNGNASALQRRP